MANSLPPILDTADYRHRMLENLQSLRGFDIPDYDEVGITYFGSTNNINVVSFKSAGTTVYQLGFTYQTSPPTTDDANLINVKKL